MKFLERGSPDLYKHTHTYIFFVVNLYEVTQVYLVLLLLLHIYIYIYI